MNEQLQKVRGQPARRKEIIDAARALAAEEGWPAVTLRAIAARIGCSAPAIYQYFQDKDALLSALAATGREEMNRALEAAAAEDHGPAKRLRAMLRALWDFSIDNRELFAVMVGIDGLAAHRDTAAGALAPAALTRAAAELLSKHDGRENPQDLADRLFATANGFIGLAAGGAFPEGVEQASELFARTIDALLKDIRR